MLTWISGLGGVALAIIAWAENMRAKKYQELYFRSKEEARIVARLVHSNLIIDGEMIATARKILENVKLYIDTANDNTIELNLDYRQAGRELSETIGEFLALQRDPVGDFNRELLKEFGSNGEDREDETRTDHGIRR